MPSDGHNGAADLGRLGAVYRRRNYADRGPLFTQLLERECGVRYQQPLVADSMLRYLCSTDEATFHMYSAAAGTPVPPFTISFSTVVCDGHLLAVGDEEGYVSLLDTSVPVEYDHWGRLLPRPGGHSFWQAHRNAIMAIAWAERDTKLLVASADQTVTEWDVESRRLVCTMQGHRGTVTCLATNPTQPTECVSGGRDGALLFWDRRQSGGSCGSGRRRGGPVIANLQAAGGSEASTVTSLAAYRTIANLHVSKEQRESYTAGQRPRRRRSTLTAGSTSSIPADDYISKTVTAVLYTHDEHQLVSAGAADGVIKFWDFRVWRSSLDSAPSRLSASSSPCHDPARPLLGVAQQPVSIGAAGRRIRHSSGISSLALDPSRTMLMASSCDGHLCQYSAIHPAAVKPVLYTGHVNSNASGTFIKCAFSPDGRYVASGSADGCGYIWAVSHTADRNEGSMGSPQWCLPGHSDECTSVTWAGLAAGRDGWCKLATASDDGTIRIWQPITEPDAFNRCCYATLVPPSSASSSSTCARLEFRHRRYFYGNIDAGTARLRGRDNKLKKHNRLTPGNDTTPFAAPDFGRPRKALRGKSLSCSASRSRNSATVQRSIESFLDPINES